LREEEDIIRDVESGILNAEDNGGGVISKNFKGIVEE
jgi:hypothetical protein